MKDIISRIEILEKKYQKNPLFVLAELPDSGELQRMTVKEMMEKDLGFVRVVGGTDVKDLDLILDRFKRIAEAEIIEL